MNTPSLITYIIYLYIICVITGVVGFVFKVLSYMFCFVPIVKRVMSREGSAMIKYSLVQFDQFIKFRNTLLADNSIIKKYSHRSSIVV
jgi:hypothetical protein